MRDVFNILLFLAKPIFFVLASLYTAYNNTALAFNEYRILEAERIWYWEKRTKEEHELWAGMASWVLSMIAWVVYFCVMPFERWIVFPPLVIGICRAPSLLRIPLQAGVCASVMIGYLKFVVGPAQIFVM